MVIPMNSVKFGLFCLLFPPIVIVSADEQAAESTPDVELGELNLPDAGDEKFQAHLTSDGLLAGRFRILDSTTGQASSPPDLTVLLIQRGRILQKIERTVDGVFQAEGIIPGVYSVIAASRQGYSSFGVEVVPAEDAGKTDGADSAALSIDAYLVSERDFPAVFEVFRRFAAASSIDSRRSGGGSSAGMIPTATSADNTEVELIETSLRQPTLLLDDTGNGYGEIVSIDPVSGAPRPVPGARVALIQNGVVVQQPVTSQDGYFEVSGLSEGIYSLAVATPLGSTAVAISAETSIAFAATDDSGDGTFPVAFQSGGGLVVPLAGSDANSFQPGQGGTAGPGSAGASGAGATGGAGAAGAGAGGAGATGGAAAGAGGAGGLLGAVTAAAVGAGVAAGLDDDAAPVSPVTPTP